MTARNHVGSLDAEGEQLTILAAAIRFHETIHWVAQPGRHHDVIASMVDKGFAPPIKGTQGFLLSDGTFATREDAYRIAAANDLFKPSVRPKLYSEDLW